MPRGLATRVHATLSWAVIAPAALLAQTAAAEPGVEWSAPAECPSAAQAAAEIDKVRVPGASATARARVEIRRESALSLRAQVAVRAQGQAREQVLRDADCGALTRAAALVVAMAAEPHAVAQERGKGKLPPTAAATVNADADARNRASAGEGSTEVASAPPLAAQPQPDSSAVPEAAAKVTAAPAPSAPSQERVILPVPLPDRRSASPGPRVTLTPQPTAAERRDRGVSGDTNDPNDGDRRIRGFLSTAVGASAGIIPNLAPCIWMSAGILTRELRAAVRFGYLPRQHAWLDAAERTGGHVALTSAAAEGGYRLQLSALEVPLVGGIEGGLFSADANGVEEHSARREAWLAAFAGSGLAVTWEKLLGVALRVEGVVALRRPSFALASADGAEKRVFHRPSALGARVYLSLELQFL